jgi:hypothetical protein
LTPQREGREENLPGIPEENSLPPGSKKGCPQEADGGPDLKKGRVNRKQVFGCYVSTKLWHFFFSAMWKIVETAGELW